MGQKCSTLKVSAHLEVVGQCGGADRLTLCLPRSRGKGGRRLLGDFTFPSARDGAGHHRSAHGNLVPIGRVTKKDGATPVRVDILAGASLVARREIPLADLLAGLKANTIGRRSALFFTVKADQAENADGGAAGSQGQAPVAVYYSRRLLDDRGPPQEDHQKEPAETEQHASLPPQAGRTKLILPPLAVYTSTTLIPEVTYSNLTPKVTVKDLMDGQRWAAPQTHPWQETGHNLQAGEIVTSSTPEVVHRDLGDGQRWVAPQTRPWQEREHARESGETVACQTTEVTHRDLGDGQRWAALQTQLLHRRGEHRGRTSVREREGVAFQSSITFPSKQKKEPLWDGRGGGRGRLYGPCLIGSLLHCVLAMNFTLLVYHLCLEWF
ncbi:hypothetical protein E2C01_068793 [Portunus trituberculatus]|uniref:Uncharacterized protein n=1 Tax=Portunus trituberculatus TaxID=210409 RepID=A0A5B7HX59_PORTR|nr:hypothetical protein [Portunus trituberculatus]